MIHRIFVEKKPAYALEADNLLAEINNILQIASLDKVRIFNRYDVEGIAEDVFKTAVTNVFSEPMVDDTYDALEDADGALTFAVEYLPGQYDQRADSAGACIRIIARGAAPIVRAARVYKLYGNISDAELEVIKKHLINPVDSREALLELPETLQTEYDIPQSVEILDGFTDLDKEGLKDFLSKHGLAMDEDDIAFFQEYFKGEKRNPSITEVKLVDTYWSDHCRHTTFLTTIDKVSFDDEILEQAYERYLDTRNELKREKPVNLMDIATLAAKYLKATGKLNKLDESEEINACTVKMDVEIDGKTEPWLLLFKNETHNHPTEIEPFGGAATCIGGAIRDPLSGRSYVYGAMRLTGAADPLVPVSETMKGKLSQRKIVTTAASGYSSYGNQIGIATGIVDEIYHPGYAAKRMEIGAVIAAAPAENVRRERPVPGDIVILLGGKTGRDGCGGATGASKSHNLSSLDTCGAEVQKGNAPEERKLQRLFRNKEACLMIKRCNDFGAGGVSVAIGELAEGLAIDLNRVPKKYEGLDGTELAISESQERMAVVVAKEDADAFIALANGENLEATAVAEVTGNGRLTMSWNGNTIVDLSREFLDSNGAEKHIEISAPATGYKSKTAESDVIDFASAFKELAGDLNVCSKRGLGQRFDSTIGAGTVLMPFGGKKQRTPSQAMAQKISTPMGKTGDCSLMSWGYNPFISGDSPYHGGYLAVTESVSKLIASGAAFEDVYLTFQEYFQKLGKDSKRWGKPFAALLGAFEAQLDYGIAAIGGKDSMSGSFENLHVPSTLVSFAVTTDKVKNIKGNEFKKAGNRVILLKPGYNNKALPEAASQIEIWHSVHELMKAGTAVSCYTPGMECIAGSVLKMCLGNGFGFDFADGLELKQLFDYCYGGFLLEVTESFNAADCNAAVVLGTVTDKAEISFEGRVVSLEEISSIYEDKLESVFSCNISQGESECRTVSYKAEGYRLPAVKIAKPRVLIPVFPGTNCEFDSAKAMAYAGAEPEILVINNLSEVGIVESVKAAAKSIDNSQMIFIPGGFSGGDEPEGAAKFITAFFRNDSVHAAVERLLDEREGLMCGICNGFQALVKLGLVPYGKIMEPEKNQATLTYNYIGCHQSKIARIRIASNKSPWLGLKQTGDIVSVPISHGEGRFIAGEELLASMLENGQIATQYVDYDGNASYGIDFNPNNSMLAIEGATSPDGRVFGKMGHSERTGEGLYRNVPGDYDMRMFEGAVAYFKHEL